MTDGGRGNRQSDQGRVADALAVRVRALAEQAEALEAPGWPQDPDAAWAVLRAHADLIEARAALLGAVNGLVVEAATAAYREQHGWAYAMTDLLSACQLGVLEAVPHYDEGRGAFSTCARLYMRLALREWGINLTRRIGTARGGARAMKAGGRLAEAAAATASVLSLTPDRDARACGPDADPADRSCAGLPGREAELEDDRAWVRRWLSRIDPAHARLVRDRYGLDGRPPASFARVAARNGIGKQQAARIVRRAVAAMRAAAGEALPPL